MFRAVLGRLASRTERQLYSRLEFITGISKGGMMYQARSGGIRVQAPNISPFLPVPRDHIEHTLSSSRIQQNVCSVSAQGSPLKTQSSGG